MRFVGFIGPSYTQQSVNVDCQRCINLYPQIDELGTGKEREVASLVGTEGLNLLTTFGTGPIRGAFLASSGELFVVNGSAVCIMSDAWVPTNIGTLATSSGPVCFADSGVRLAIVDGSTSGFFYNYNTFVWSAIPFPTDIDFIGFNGCDSVTFQDGYFIYAHKNTQQFFISGTVDSITGNDDSTISALDFAAKSSSSDILLGVLSDHQDIWMFGTRTIEIWFNSGSSDFPFQRVSGAFIQHGCASIHTVQQMNNTLFWLGQDDKGQGIVFQAQGYQPQRISTHAVELAIKSYGDISGATSLCYQSGGHNFYFLNFPSANTTWVFDATTSLWHERVYTNQGNFERHRASCHAFAYGKHIVGDYQNGNLYELSETVYSDNGNAITRQRVSPHLTQGLKRNFYGSFQLDVESGTGLDGNGQGIDPQAMLEFSDDGGHAWSNEKWTGFGKIGQTSRRAIWRKLGVSRDRVFKVTITDPVKTVIIGAELEIEGGAA